MVQEIDTAARTSLCSRLPADTCVFSDILEVYGQPCEFEANLGKLQNFSQKLAYSCSVPRHDTGYCLRHGQQCAFRGPANSGGPRVQGIPCPDWSRAGNLQKEDGPWLCTALAAGAKVEVTQDPLLILENVPAFPLWMAQACYGREYTFQQMFQDPSQVGFEMMARSRSRAVCYANFAK